MSSMASGSMGSRRGGLQADRSIELRCEIRRLNPCFSRDHRREILADEPDRRYCADRYADVGQIEDRPPAYLHEVDHGAAPPQIVEIAGRPAEGGTEGGARGWVLEETPVSDDQQQSDEDRSP